MMGNAIVGYDSHRRHSSPGAVPPRHALSRGSREGRGHKRGTAEFDETGLVLLHEHVAQDCHRNEAEGEVAQASNLGTNWRFPNLETEVHFGCIERCAEQETIQVYLIQLKRPNTQAISNVGKP